ncbi:MAG: hypothetical protein LQ346_008188 [Caloplaca aetnensis]|nr:MAG: hypothetical protein LQ346_008188 [Caloplaca aetnensis]
MAPKFKPITYVWKMPRPKNQEWAEELMRAAYDTAMRIDRDTKVILIRSDPHTTTRAGKHYVGDDPHVTISCKSSHQILDGTHQTIHGYTRSLKNLEVLRAEPSDYVNPDDTIDNKGKLVWPGGLPEEEQWHPL